VSERSHTDFPSLTPAGPVPKIRSIFDFTDEALQQLRLWLEMHPPAVPINSVLGFQQQIRFLDRSTSSVNVFNTTSETPLYTFTVNGGDMGSDRLIRLTIIGDFLYNNSVSDTVTVRVKFGGSVLWGNAGLLGNPGTARHPWALAIHIANQGDTGSQFMYGWFISERSDISAPTVAGIGDAVSTESNVLGFPLATSGLSSIDTTVGQTLQVTAQWSVASASNSMRKRYGLLELL
jgi:hypothetical protein